MNAKMPMQKLGSCGITGCRRSSCGRGRDGGGCTGRNGAPRRVHRSETTHVRLARFDPLRLHKLLLGSIE